MIVPYNENISFDFEDYREKTRKDDKYNGKEHLRRDPKRGTVVCSHWLVGLCSSQESGDCQYLHRLDRSKMPKCRYGTHCKIKNCLLAHVEEEEKPECPFFHQGFCMRGPYCKYRHVKLGPEDLPDVADFNLVLSTGGGGGGAGAAGEPGQPFKKPRKVVNAADGSSIELYKVSLCRYFQERGNCPFGTNCNYAHGEAELREVRGRTRDHSGLSGPSSSVGGGIMSAPRPDYYTGDACGFMFTCEPAMVPEIFHKRILGLPLHMKEAAMKGISVNSPLFFYDSVNHNIFGLYKAACPVTDNIDRNLYATTCKLPCPVQVRFEIDLDAAPANAMEPELIMMFGPSKPPRVGPMSMLETKFLANLFATRCGAMPSGALGGGAGHGSSSERSRSGGGVENTGMYRPPFQFTSIVPIGIPFTFQSLPELKRRLIGQANERIFQLVKELGGQYKVRLRLRGIGSGFREGNLSQELQEPLHFNVSCENEALLKHALDVMREHVNMTKSEMGQPVL